MILSGVCVWLALVCAGMCSLLNYSNAQGEAGSAPEVWPAASQIPRPASGFVLVMMVHPQCSCSVATLAELQEFLARVERPPATYVIFHLEGGERSRVMKTELWRAAAAIPGVTLVADDGTEARIFGAKTSGEAVLYDASGRSRFHGGITGSRGHQGENYGLNTLLAAVRGGRESSVAAWSGAGVGTSAPVFGCPLHDPSAAELQKDRSWKSH